MIAQELKNTVDTLSAAERHDLAVYLTKRQLENDPDHWKAIRNRVEDTKPERWVNADDL